MISSVINQPTSVVEKFNTIIKIHKYRRLHEGQHLIPMTMEVHGAPRRDMDCFIRECVRLLHDRQLGGHLSMSFCIQFFRQHINIVLQHVLPFTIERKIAFASDSLF
jgi:hypothetical protein